MVGRRSGGLHVLIAAVLAAAAGVWSAFAQPRVTIETADGVVAGAPALEQTITGSDDLAPVLAACLFADTPKSSTTARAITPQAFATDCVVPYINGLWLDRQALLRTHDGIAEQATDKLIVHPQGEPYPIYYPPELGELIVAKLRDPLAGADNVAVKPLPEELPPPSLSKDSLYNNIGLLYLPNAYVVPGGTFNEMYGWDSFFIIKGLLASVESIMANPTSRAWSVSDQAMVQLVDDPESPHHYRAYAERLFQVAKGMVDNHIFEIAYYGGFVLNANRTYYLTRSQPPLFTQEALAVLESARRHGFAYSETLAPYLSTTEVGFSPPQTWAEWIESEVLPAAEAYYDYWTDPAATVLGSSTNPRVASIMHGNRGHDVYLYGTDGVGPAPEVARSTEPQNRALYADAAKYFAENTTNNPDNRFYNPVTVCTGSEPAEGCGDPDYHLTQAFYRADRAMRASGYDLSGRFGEQGEWTMNFAPMALNVLLLQMAEDIDRMAALVGETERFGAETLDERRAFLASYFALPSGEGLADQFMGTARPPFVPAHAYPYATQFYFLWGEILDGAALSRATETLLENFLDPGAVGRFGIPTSLEETGKQWDAPYAWAPIQYFAADGLAANGYHADAARVMLEWIAAVNLFFAETGTIIEKYDSRDPTEDPRVKVGYAQAQRGFGWTNAVYMLFVNRLYDRL